MSTTDKLKEMQSQIIGMIEGGAFGEHTSEDCVSCIAARIADDIESLLFRLRLDGGK